MTVIEKDKANSVSPNHILPSCVMGKYPMSTPWICDLDVNGLSLKAFRHPLFTLIRPLGMMILAAMV